MNPVSSQEVEWEELPGDDKDDEEKTAKLSKNTKDKEKGDSKSTVKKVVKGGKIVIEKADSKDDEDAEDLPQIKVKTNKNSK